MRRRLCPAEGYAVCGGVFVCVCELQVSQRCLTVDRCSTQSTKDPSVLACINSGLFLRGPSSRLHNTQAARPFRQMKRLGWWWWCWWAPGFYWGSGGTAASPSGQRSLGWLLIRWLLFIFFADETTSSYRSHTQTHAAPQPLKINKTEESGLCCRSIVYV